VKLKCIIRFSTKSNQCLPNCPLFIEAIFIFLYFVEIFPAASSAFFHTAIANAVWPTPFTNQREQIGET